MVLVARFKPPTNPRMRRLDRKMPKWQHRRWVFKEDPFTIHSMLWPKLELAQSDSGLPLQEEIKEFYMQDMQKKSKVRIPRYLQDRIRNSFFLETNVWKWLIQQDTQRNPQKLELTPSGIHRHSNWKFSTRKTLWESYLKRGWMKFPGKTPLFRDFCPSGSNISIHQLYFCNWYSQIWTMSMRSQACTADHAVHGKWELCHCWNWELAVFPGSNVLMLLEVYCMSLAYQYDILYCNYNIFIYNQYIIIESHNKFWRLLAKETLPILVSCQSNISRPRRMIYLCFNQLGHHIFAKFLSTLSWENFVQTGKLAIKTSWEVIKKAKKT